MRAHYLQHVPFEDLGSIENWLRETEFAITRTRFFSSDPLPRIDDIDFLIVLGGPMSVHDRSDYPWLEREIEYIGTFARTGKSILGICLGAQLIALAMGAEVGQNAVKEIGWFPVHGIDHAHPVAYRFPDELTVFHWHGETFSLPPDAVHLACSKGCRNQAFQIGENIIGLQFHLETTLQTAGVMVSNCRNELIPDTYIQDEETILSAPEARYGYMNDIMDSILRYLNR